MFDTIINEMFAGNFSFAILAIGVLQLVVMIIGLFVKRQAPIANVRLISAPIQPSNTRLYEVSADGGNCWVRQLMLPDEVVDYIHDGYLVRCCSENN